MSKDTEFVRVGDIIVYGSHLVKTVEKVRCEHFIVANGDELSTDELRFLGLVPVWGVKGSHDGDGNPSGSGLNVRKSR